MTRKLIALLLCLMLAGSLVLPFRRRRNPCGAGKNPAEIM